MCLTCYKEANQPKIINKLTRYVAGLVKKVYEFHSSGGTAHIVVDDWNVEDSNINSCLEGIKTSNYSKEQTDVEKSFLLVFKELTIDERYSVLAIADGLI